MGFFSELFVSLFVTVRGPQGAKHVFSVPWRPEGTTRDYELRSPRVFFSDINDISASNIAPILNTCKEWGSSLALVTPGVDRSVLRLLDEDTMVAIKATDLPGQPVRDLLEDAACIAGRPLICKEFGFGLTFPDSLPGADEEKGIFVPKDAWDRLEPSQLATVDWLVIGPDGTEFRQAKMERGWREAVERRATSLLREEPTPGRDERFRRLWIAAGRSLDETRALETPKTEFIPDYRIGLASDYFINEPDTMECVLDNADIAVFSEPLNNLEVLVRLLGLSSAAGCPILILAPSVSDETLATCVVTRLRGVLRCAVAIPRRASTGTEAVLAEIARRTGAQVVTQSQAQLLERESFLGRAAAIRATCDGIVLTPMSVE